MQHFLLHVAFTRSGFSGPAQTLNFGLRFCDKNANIAPVISARAVSQLIIHRLNAAITIGLR